MQTLSHQDYMSLALQLAERGRYTVSPNPMVGCVIVKHDQIIGKGYHQRAGEPHAEVHALREAGEKAMGATAYITLEPCCHVGRTPPCTTALIRAGIKKVFVATLDPNQLVNGKGIVALREAGIEVEVGLLEQQSKELNEVFFHYITTKRPFVIAKWAMSLDGKMETHPIDDRKISGNESHTSTHQLRKQVDAILIGANTALRDDPLLTVRLVETTKHPIRIILANRSLPIDLKVFNDTTSKTIVATTEKSDANWRQALSNKNIDVLLINDLNDLLDQLGKKQMTSLLIEGGKTIHESFFAADLVNKYQIYVAPVIIGSLEKKRALGNIKFSVSGDDICFEGN